MRRGLAGFTLAVVGGDQRAVYTAEELAGRGARVRLVGHEASLPGVELAKEIKAGLVGAEAVIFPFPGVQEGGEIETPSGVLHLKEEDLLPLPRGGLVFTGFANPYLLRLAERLGLKLIPVADRDDFAILNSIPTAEGALQMAMELLPITIHGSQVLVLGFGRVGKTLGRMLQALGAKVMVATREPAERARALEMGLKAIDFPALRGCIGEAEVIFNTVPALVLTARLLKHTRPDVLIIDLASKPGGTDFEAARALGRQALLAPSLPGKVAPKTAGRILGQVIAEIFVQEKGLSLAVRA
ncbi:dipicolinate synthase subunit DpsA [Ammonifex thiophilus]|uniref:Dipicolinate synthase subunit DpsA n=1 Tax=Ammonifex thiophilus TaxID=444093 RepID=A0A3D8P6C2_9THEO|nr:dipicolinate synthase subunit DpsA [Ammonifex thiophilus]RDV84876.1 dipicolinate synthase subunit DpsA [Ammonifex thiophilus]